jgi:hypothetical protein
VMQDFINQGSLTVVYVRNNCYVTDIHKSCSICSGWST